MTLAMRKNKSKEHLDSILKQGVLDEAEDGNDYDLERDP
jgi:hypothetical protein